MIQLKKFIDTFKNEKTSYEIADNKLYLASRFMILATPWHSTEPPKIIKDKVLSADPGTLSSIYREQKDSFGKKFSCIAKETGITFQVPTGRKKHTVSVLVADQKDIVPYAVYVRENYLRIFGSKYTFISVQGPTDMVAICAGDCIGFMKPIQLPDYAAHNLKAHARAILFPER